MKRPASRLPGIELNPRQQDVLGLKPDGPAVYDAGDFASLSGRAQLAHDRLIAVSKDLSAKDGLRYVVRAAIATTVINAIDREVAEAGDSYSPEDYSSLWADRAEDAPNGAGTVQDPALPELYWHIAYAAENLAKLDAASRSEHL